MRPQLKNVGWERLADGQLRLAYDLRDQFLLDDPDGSVGRLLDLLAVGRQTVAELAASLGVPVEDVNGAVALFDECGLLEDADRLGQLSAADQERYFSNLAFFESFASLSNSRDDFQRRLTGSHVLVLGTGGFNSGVIPNLCGLGVGRLTLLDRDAVEARNFARQFLYQWSDIGARKVERAAEWIRRFDPRTEIVDAVDGEIDGPELVADLIERHRPDLVSCGVDQPLEIDDWVNQACVTRGVPYVRGGISVTQGVLWSVEPGVSACRACSAGEDPDDPVLAQERAGVRLVAGRGTVNRAIGPVTSLLGSLAALEILRYLTGFEPPAYARGPLVVDFANGCRTQQGEWKRDPACAVCAGTGPRLPHHASRV